MYAYCEQVYSTTTVVQFKDSRSRKLLSIARDAAGLIRPNIQFYNGTTSSRPSGRRSAGRRKHTLPDLEQGRPDRAATPVPVFSVNPQSRCTSAAPSLLIPGTAARKGSFLDIGAGSSSSIRGTSSRVSTGSSSGSSGSGRSGKCRSLPERSVSSDDFDADSSHVHSQPPPPLHKKTGPPAATLAVVVPTSISPLTPAYQSNESIKISRMPFALFSYLQDDVLVLHPASTLR